MLCPVFFLQRLSSDRNKLVARAATSALEGLKKKWDDGASSGLLFMSFDAKGQEENRSDESDQPDDTS